MIAIERNLEHLHSYTSNRLHYQLSYPLIGVAQKSDKGRLVWHKITVKWACIYLMTVKEMSASPSQS
jgi:hypothetical protein